MASQQFEIIASPTEIVYNFEENIAQHDTSNKTEPPTNSMVTVRLSDTLSLVGEEFSKENVEHSPNKEPFPEVLNDLDMSSRETTKAEIEEERAIIADYEESRELTRKSTSASTPDHTSLGHRSISIMNRRDTRDSSSSGESAHVDWEELDKNEEQEQRDEGSDDVSMARDLNEIR